MCMNQLWVGFLPEINVFVFVFVDHVYSSVKIYVSLIFYRIFYIL